MNNEQMKRENRSRVLMCIHEKGPISRKDIARETGLTPASVTQIAGSLLEEGLLRETGLSDRPSGLAGRRKVPLEIDRSAAWFLTLNIEPERITAAAADLAGRCAEGSLRRITLGEGTPRDQLLRAAAQLRALRESLPEEIRSRLRAVSVGVIGPVDKRTGTALSAYGIWEEPVPAAEILSEELGLTVLLENNVDAYAAAELLFGGARRYENLMVIKWGPGVGCSIIIDRRLYEGRHGKAAELGHVVVEKNGRRCRCGQRGCLETKVSAPALQEVRPFAPEAFGEAYEASEGEERAAFDRAVDLFARTVVNAMTVLAPNRILLTGPMFRSPQVREKLISCCASYAPRLTPDRILYTELADREDFIGPAAAAARWYLFERG